MPKEEVNYCDWKIWKDEWRKLMSKTSNRNYIGKMKTQMKMDATTSMIATDKLKRTTMAIIMIIGTMTIRITVSEINCVINNDAAK